MTTLMTMTLVQTSEVVHHANDENMSPPLEVSCVLRCPCVVGLPLTHELLTNILQHPSRTLRQPNHHLIASLILTLMVDLVELQLRRTIVDPSNPLVI